MKKGKRILALLLAVLISANMLQTVAYAENSSGATDADATVNTDDYTLDSTNDLSGLLVDSLAETNATATSDDGSVAGYTVTGLEFEGNVATVTYSSLEDANLIVAVYTEDSMQLLLSRTVLASAEETEVSVTIEGEMPEYFMASAYLLDTYDYSPLSAQYTTPLYTQEMQALLNSTVNDYEEDLVINLDESEDTNFLVREETTIYFEAQPDVNTVVSADGEAGTYVFANADDTLTTLQAGDIVVCANGDELLIFKVSDITVSGTDVTITAADLELEEAFSHVKIEATGDTGDVSFDEDAEADDGVTCLGLVENVEAAAAAATYGIAPASLDTEGSASLKVGFTVDKEFDSNKNDGEKAKLSGFLGVELQLSVKFYVSLESQYSEVKVDTKTTFSIKFEGEKEIPIPGIKLLPFKATIYGVTVGFEPEVQVKFGAEIEFKATLVTSVGLAYDSKSGFQNLCTNPELDIDVKIEGSVFLGIDWAPTIEVAQGAIVEWKLKALTGVELTAKMTGTNYDDLYDDEEKPEYKHTCANCIELEFAAKIELSTTLKFLNMKFLTISKKITAKTFQLGVGYLSLDDLSFGFGTCPNKAWRITFQALDEAGKELHFHELLIQPEKDGVTSLGETNSYGLLTTYLSAGTYKVGFYLNGEYTWHEYIIDSSRKWIVQEGIMCQIDDVIKDKENLIVDYGSVVDSGYCGENWDTNVSYTLYSSGLLVISGNGDMHNWHWQERHAPWYNTYNILKVVIEPGVTNIGDYAFYDCTNLTSIEIPSGVTSIGYGAFYACESLTSIEIPNSVTSIGYSAFAYCDNLASIKIPNSVTSIGNYAFKCCESLTSIEIPNSVTSIGDFTFEYCYSLSTIEIPNSVTSIGNSAFRGCSSLTSIEIPNSVTSIGGYAFSGCTSLSSIKIPNSVASVGEGAFNYCKSLTSIEIPNSVTSIDVCAFRYCVNLTSIEIPNSVTSVGGGAFIGCESLTSIEIPNSVTSIGFEAFCGCTSLSSIKIPDGVTSIGYSAFAYCDNLASIEIPDGVTSIDDFTFGYCYSLSTIEIPNSVTSIGDSAFYYCNNLTSIVIPNSVTSIGDDAFYACESLSSIEIPDGVTSIGDSTFAYCDNLASIKIPNSVTSIGNYAFIGCESLTSIEIPNSVTSIGFETFYRCINLSSVLFEGQVPSFGQDAFGCVTATCYYPAGDKTWTEDVMQDYGGVLTWVSYEPLNAADAEEPVTSELTVMALDVAEPVTSEFAVMGLKAEETEPAEVLDDLEVVNVGIELYGIYEGDTSAEDTEEGCVRSATFTNLVPNAQYVLLVIADLEADELLSGDNLLYIAQATAPEDGTLTFRYIQREETAVSYVVACGAASKNLSDAVITLPEMHAGEEAQAVAPVVTYEGETLTENKDYIILGTADYTQAGDYVCYLRGIYDYAGLIACTYTVNEPKTHTPGDINGDGKVNNKDATRLFQYLAGWKVIVAEAALDVNGDGAINNKDATRLFQYLAGWNVTIY